MREAVVVVRERGGEAGLVGYVVREVGSEVSGEELRGYLRERLPGYMVPWAVVELAGLPLTASGKVDRQGLPEPEGASDGEGRQERARTAVEEVLGAIWEEVLGVEGIGLEEDFFALGGHSLLAARLLFRAQETFHVDLALRHVFEHPTIAALAQSIEALQWADESLQAAATAPLAMGSREEGVL